MKSFTLKYKKLTALIWRTPVLKKLSPGHCVSQESGRVQWAVGSSMELRWGDPSRRFTRKNFKWKPSRPFNRFICWRERDKERSSWYEAKVQDPRKMDESKQILSRGWLGDPEEYPELKKVAAALLPRAVGSRPSRWEERYWWPGQHGVFQGSLAGQLTPNKATMTDYFSRFY